MNEPSIIRAARSQRTTAVVTLALFPMLTAAGVVSAVDRSAAPKHSTAGPDRGSFVAFPSHHLTAGATQHVAASGGFADAPPYRPVDLYGGKFVFIRDLDG